MKSYSERTMRGVFVTLAACSVTVLVGVGLTVLLGGC